MRLENGQGTVRVDIQGEFKMQDRLKTITLIVQL